MGPGRALDLLGPAADRRREALRIGLVEYLAEPAQLVDAPALRAAAAEVSPASIADTKRLVYRHLGVGYPEALGEIDDVQWAAVARADAREGAMALLERRAPSFPPAARPAGAARRLTTDAAAPAAPAAGFRRRRRAPDSSTSPRRPAPPRRRR